MKKLTTLALAAGLIVAAAAPASAVDTKVDGQYLFSFARNDYSFDKNANADTEFAQQRIRLGLTFTASENLAGYVQFQSVDTWGTKHNAIADTGVRQLYIDWMVPSTPVKVRLGKIQCGLPAHAFGQSMMMGPGNNRYAVVASAPVADWMDVTAMWTRQAIAQQQTEGTWDNPETGEFLDDVTSGSNDAFALTANVKLDGLTITPTVMYAVDSRTDTTFAVETPKTNNKSQTIWGEVTANLTMFDPLNVKATVGTAYTDKEKADDVKGWYGMALASYKMSFGTPVFGFWYGSGAEENEAIATTRLSAFGGGKVAQGIAFTDNSYGLDSGVIAGCSINGTWGLKLGVNGLSFLEGLTHDVAVLMYKGTNHDSTVSGDLYVKGATNLAWTDTVYEFDLSNTYQIYKNLAANLQLAYILNDVNEDLHKDYEDDGWRAALTFQYKF